MVPWYPALPVLVTAKEERWKWGRLGEDHRREALVVCPKGLAGLGQKLDPIAPR